MNERVRTGVDITAAFASPMKRVSASAESAPAAPAVMSAPPTPLPAQGSRAPSTNLLRVPARLLYRCVKPLIRPLAVRLRRYFIAPVDDRWRECVTGLEALRQSQSAYHEEMTRRHVALVLQMRNSLRRLEDDVEGLGLATTQALDAAAGVDATIHAARLAALQEGVAAIAAPAERLDARLASAVRLLQEESDTLRRMLVGVTDASRTTVVRELEAGLDRVHNQTAELTEWQRRFEREAERRQDALSAELQEARLQAARVESYAHAAARRVAIGDASGHVLLRTTVGYVLCPADDHALVALIAETGEVEPGTRRVIQRILRSGDLFVDVGANLGLHTLAACQTVGSGGQVIAFEPFERTAQLLERTVWINGFSGITTLHCAAVSDRPSQRTLFLGRTSGHHSIVRSPLAPGISSAVEVPSVALDDCLAGTSPTLVKIDVEGAELLVLEGARTLIRQTPEIGVIVEFGPEHLSRSGVSAAEWLNAFSVLGLRYLRIMEDTGTLSACSTDELVSLTSTNLLWARPDSPVWQRAEARA